MPIQPFSLHSSNLPYQQTPFVGRHKELRTISQLLGDAACRLLTLVGPGGIGKTRLALRAVEEPSTLFPHGVFFVPLLTSSSTADLVSAIADATGLSFASGRDPRVQLLDYLSEKVALLVLDSLEHLCAPACDENEGGIALLIDILETSLAVKILATSQGRLRLQRECVLEIHGLEFPESGDTAEVEGYSAVQLFVQSARRVCPNFRLSKEETSAVVCLCRLVEGMPLALELAAAQARVLSCQEICAAVESHLDILVSSMRDVPERQQSIKAVFDYSWQFLTEQERKTLGQLAVFRGGFQGEAAERVSGASLPILIRLIDQSLLYKAPPGRYKMLEVLRRYAEAKLTQFPQLAEETRDRHCEYFAAWLQSWEPALHGGGQSQALTALEEELDNVRQAWRWAVERAKVEQIVVCLPSLYRFYEMRGRLQEGEAVFAQAVKELNRQAAPSAMMERVLWSITARYGVFCYHLGRYQAAQEQLQQSLAAFRTASEQEEIAFCLTGLARMALREEENLIAERLFEEALVQAQAVPSRPMEIDNLCGLGNVALQRGDYATAKDYYERALELCRDACDQWNEAILLNNLGAVSDHSGDYARARSYYAASLELKQSLNDRRGEAVALVNLGFAWHRLGDAAAAKIHSLMSSIAWTFALYKTSDLAYE
jgi:predicted ATPase